MVEREFSLRFFEIEKSCHLVGLDRTQIIKTPLHYNTQVTGLATCGVVEWMCCSTIKKSESRSVVEWSVMQPGSSVALVALSQYHVGRTAGTK